MGENDNDIVTQIRERNRLYSLYASPEFNYREYRLAISNIPIDSAPDSYGIDDWFSSAFYTWDRNKHESEMNTAYGDYTMMELDELTLRSLRDYLTATDLETLKANENAFITVSAGRMNNSKINDRINTLMQQGKYDKVITEIDKELFMPEGHDYTNYEDLNNLAVRKLMALQEANIAKQELDKSDAKINPYFKSKDETNNIDFTDIDTYLYKLPGLMGSSAATLAADIATTAGAFAAGALGGAIGGLPGMIIGGLASATISIAGNVYSRRAESKGEVYTNYKSKVQQELEKKGIYNNTILDAKAKMRASGQYTEELLNDDDFVLDLVLTNQVTLHDNLLDKIKIDNMQGLRDLYLDNMALSTSDILLTVIEITPLRFAKLVPKGLTKALTDRTNKVLSYGLDKVDDLSTLSRRHAIVDYGGRILVSSVMEGMEEGTQYIKGLNYINNSLNQDATFVERWASNIATGARSAFAVLTPWDPVYSDDKELMENFKGGMLLGGIMTGAYAAVPSILNEKKLEQGNRVVQLVFADNERIKDRVRKNQYYSEAASNNRSDLVQLAFLYLKDLNIEGLDQADINEEQNYSNVIRNMTNASSVKEQAEKLGIDPRSKEYNSYVALRYYYNDEAEKSLGRFNESLLQMQSLLNSDAAKKHIAQLTKELTDKGVEVTEDHIRTAIETNELEQVYSKLIQEDKVNAEKLEELAKNLNITSNSTDTYNLASILEKNLKQVQELRGLSMVNDMFLALHGITRNRLLIPEIQEDLSKAVEQHVFNKLDADRYAEELKLWNSDNRGEEIRKKINDYLNVDDRNRKFVSDLDDIDAGKDIDRANETAQVVEPESIDSNQPEAQSTTESTTQPETPEPEVTNQSTFNVSESTESEEDINATIDLARKGDEKARLELQEYGIEYGTAGVYRHVGSSEIEALKKGEKIPGKNPTIGADVTASEQPTTGSDAEYRVKYKSNFDLYKDSSNGNRAKMKSSELTDGYITGGYSLEDVDVIERRNDDGTYTIVYENGKFVEDDVEPSELIETRNKITKIREEVAEDDNGHLRLKTGTKARDVYDQASLLIREDFISRHPAVTDYREYVATNELNGLTGLRYDKLSEIIEYRDRMEEEILTNGNTAKANGYKGYLTRLMNEYNEIVASEQKIEELNKQKEQTRPTENAKANEAEPVSPVKSEATRPAQVTDVPDLASLMGDWLGLEVADAMNAPTLPTTETPQVLPQQPVELPQSATQEPTQTLLEAIPELPELTYDKRIDKYSHEANYRLKNEDGSSKKFLGMEEYANDIEFADVVTNPDFLSETREGTEVIVRPYNNPDTGLTEDAIYITFPYKGKNYVASLLTREGMQRRLAYKRLPHSQELIILANLLALRDKAIALYRATENNPNLKVVPTIVRTTNGRIVNELNPDGSPKNRKLTESAHLQVKDPYEITPDNTRIGISTGGRGRSDIRFRNQTISGKGKPLGQPMWVVPFRRLDGSTDNLVIKLNYATFKDSPEVSKLIVDLLLNESNSYVDANGVNTGVNPKNLLKFIVNYGTHTAVNPNDIRLTPDLISRLQAKQFYFDENNNLILGRNAYPISQIISDSATRAQVEQYITDNFHWAIDEDSLTRTYLGGTLLSQVRDLRFGPMEALLRTSDVDNVVLIPGKLEFGLKDFGIIKDANGKKSIDENHPNGISVLGWYIKQGILLTDASDTLKDANIYIDDVRVVDTRTELNIKEALTEIKETAEQANTIELPTIDGGTRVVDINATMALLDGKKKKGPNMEVEEDYVEGLAVNDENRMNAQLATKWLEEKLGITPEITLSVVDVTEAGHAVVGRVTEDSILLSELAPEGTEYHEAWHRVSQLLISDKLRKKIYDRYRRKHKTNLSDTELDEIFAENFRQFQLDESLSYDFETKNWFRRILDFIRLWARTGSYALAKIYFDINRAKYNGVLPGAENVLRFRSIYQGEGPNLEVMGYSFKNITTVKEFDDVVKSLTYAFFRINAADGHTINYSDLRTEKPRFDTLKLILLALNYKNPSDAVLEIIDKFDDIFAPTIANNLKNLGIRTIDLNEDLTISDIEEGAEGVNIGQHTVESMNVSIKDNAPAEVKFFFLTIPDYEIGTDGRPRVKINPITHFPSFVDTNKSWVNVLKDLSGCRTISNMYAKVAQLAKQGDPYYQALLLKLDTEINVRSQSSDERERMDSEALLTKIETVVTSDVNNFVTVKISRDRDTKLVSMSLVDNGVDIKAMNYPGVWSLSLFNNSGIFRTNENGDVTSSSKAKHDLKQVIDNLNGLKAAFISRRGLFNFRGKDYDLHTEANIQIAKAFIVSNLNAVGIGIDVATLNKMFASGDFGPVTADNYSILNTFVTGAGVYGSLSKIIDTLLSIYKSIDNQGTLTLIKTYDNQTINPKYVWNNLGIIKYMALYYANVHATDRSLQSVGPDNTSYYQVSLNNFAKDRLNEIINDEEVRQQLESVVYNKGSIVLDAVRRGNKNLAIETFINFKDTTSQDTGRDYFGITDREDYIAKLTAVLNNRLIFPTVADKKTYHLIRGLTLPHDPITLYGNSASFFTKYGDLALDILIGYCYDELNQIELCLRQIDDDPTHIRTIDGKEVHINEDGTINNDWLEPTRRIKNFHTPNSVTWTDKNNVEHTRTIEGNGARFLFLTGIYTLETDSNGRKVKKFINFNDPMKSAQENLQTAKEYFFNRTPEVLKAFLSAIINNRVRQEILTAKELGLITINENNDIWSMRNVLLDTKILEDRKQRYTQFDAVNAEAYAILDILSDYTMNSIISIQEVEKLFSGAPAYYKVAYDKDGLVDVSIDKIKRLGSLTSTGVNNRLDFFNDQLESDEYTVAELKDHEIRDKQYNELEQLFTRGNIKEVIQEYKGQEAWDEVKNMSIKEIEEKYPEEVKIAKAAAKKDVAGYKQGINVADAAVYISPKMAENLLRMRGIWSYDIKQAFDILSNPETADKWESDPTLYAKANKVVLNAMKYVAFGTRFDEIPGLGIPYFNKMALFPLFKSIATGDIKKLYDRMTAPGREIGMVMFNSAVKAGSRNPVKPYRQAKDSEIELKDGQTILSAELQDRLENDQEFRPNDYDKLVTYKLKYKYIRQLLETNPHTHEELMLGTQFMKVNLSNLRDGDLYGVEGDYVTGEQIKTTVMSTLNRLSDIGVEKIRKQVYNDDGEVDTTKLVSMLASDARDSDANDNVLSGLRIDENGDLTMPLDALSDNKWLESRFISMINKDVVDVHMPGGAFIQRSAFGLEATAQDVITENMINDGKPLLMINEEDGSMDSVVSINMFKHIIPNYNKMTFRLARQWLIDHNIIGQNAKANAIGYRIPTQSIASISALRFVDVFPEIMGDTIMLPEGFTKLTGSDFD